MYKRQALYYTICTNISTRRISANHSGLCQFTGSQVVFHTSVSTSFRWSMGERSQSVKFHLWRVIGRTLLNFEEHYTVLTQIESCLNSRPLFAISNDSGEPEPLTPAHFLVCSPLNSLPEPDYSDIKMGRLGRWQLLQSFTNSI